MMMEEEEEEGEEEEGKEGKEGKEGEGFCGLKKENHLLQHLRRV